MSLLYHQLLIRNVIRAIPFAASAFKQVMAGCKRSRIISLAKDTLHYIAVVALSSTL
jgi:hypothetical protein